MIVKRMEIWTPLKRVQHRIGGGKGSTTRLRTSSISVASGASESSDDAMQLDAARVRHRRPSS